MDFGELIGFITREEADHYSALASNYTGEGLVVDAGCFVGASTLALCRGLAGNAVPDGRFVVAIDRFVVADRYILDSLMNAGKDVNYGESFLGFFLDTVREYVDHIDVRAGDVTNIGRITSPIELLTIDIAKSPATLAYGLRSWFQRLIPGKSVVVHQDFYGPAQPWIAVTMGMLLDYFQLMGGRVGESATFRCIKEIPRSAIEQAISVQPASDEGLLALDRIAALVDPESRRLLHLTKSMMLSYLGRGSQATELLYEVAAGLPCAAEKWNKWLAIAAAKVEPTFCDARSALWGAYLEYGAARLGE
jgi:hypothetical protein